MNNILYNVSRSPPDKIPEVNAANPETGDCLSLQILRRRPQQQLMATKYPFLHVPIKATPTVQVDDIPEPVHKETTLHMIRVSGRKIPGLIIFKPYTYNIRNRPC